MRGSAPSRLPLFDERPPFDRDRLAAKLAQLSEQGIFIGTSSWKYEGWCGQIYTRQRYMVRGNFAPNVFARECLREYGETFPVVGGDFTFYQFPAEQYWRDLFALATPGLQFALKVPEAITSHAPRGLAPGQRNTSFLDAALFEEAFLEPLEPFRDRIAALIFEFTTFPRTLYSQVREFTRDLDRFFAAVPRQVRYSVEVRNEDFLAAEYFHCLRANRVAHVFNGWSRMPEIGAQIRNRDAFTADFTVCRGLLRRGRPYETAVEMFEPYEDIQDPNPEGRRAIRDLIDYARNHSLAAFIFVNNRFEGNAPRTIEAIAEAV